MKKVLLILLVFFIIGMDSVYANHKVDYVCTKDNVIYKVDMDSIKFSDGIMIFWSEVDDLNKKTYSYALINIKEDVDEFRFEDLIIIQKSKDKDNEQIIKPTEWRQFTKDSPVGCMVIYILKNSKDLAECILELK